MHVSCVLARNGASYATVRIDLAPSSSRYELNMERGFAADLYSNASALFAPAYLRGPRKDNSHESFFACHCAVVSRGGICFIRRTCPGRSANRTRYRRVTEGLLRRLR